MNSSMIINLNNSSKKLFNLGFVKLVDCMPRVIPEPVKRLKCDSAIVESARVSFGDTFKDYDTDKKLIKYLFRNKHTSPFEMVKFKFHIKAPIFVQRQWIRHRTANVNEISGRYSEMKEAMYIPEELRSQDKINKQGSKFTFIPRPAVVEDYTNSLVDNIRSYENYKKLVDHGVSRELARIFLPLNLYTEFYWCIDLHNLLNFIKLRESPEAQYEIREYAKAVKELASEFCPITFECHEEYTSNSIQLSSKEQQLINEKNFSQDNFESTSEYHAFIKKVNKLNIKS